MSQPPNQHKPTFFRTLPDQIAKSPTGITKIPNSRFPSLAPINPVTYKSVYERAGFEVYKPKSGERSRPSSPTVAQGFRSVSTSQLNSNTAKHSGVFEQKRNASEQFHPGRSSPSSQIPLSIDAKLANRAYSTAPNSQPNTASSGSRTSTRQTTFNSTGGNHSSVQSGDSGYTNNGSGVPGSVYTTAESLAHSVKSNNTSPLRSLKSSASSVRESQSSTPVANQQYQRHSPNRGSYVSSVSSRSNSSRNSYTASRSLHSINNLPTHQEYDDTNDYSFEQTNYDDFNTSKMTNGSTNTVKYNPVNKSINTNPVINIEDSDGDDDNELNLSSDEEAEVKSQDHTDLHTQLDISDVESMKSTILSPALPSTSTLSPEQVSAKLRSSSPPPPLPTVSLNDQVMRLENQEENYDGFSNGAVSNGLSPPVGYIRNNRDSAATSIYSNEFSTRHNSSGTPTNDSGYDDGDEQQDHTAPVYQEVENQLESLSLNNANSKKGPSFSPNPNLEPFSHNGTRELQIEMHSIKQSNTEQQSEDDVHSIQPSITSSHNHFHTQPSLPVSLPTEQTEPLHFHSKSQSIEKKPQEPLVVKYPAGEGPCRKCGLEIPSRPIYSKSGELSGQWHRNCFTCTLCDLKFSKKVNCFVLKDEPYCEYHYHLSNNSLCQICGSGIVGKCLENDAQDRYHIECLKCSKCQSLIDSDYISVNGAVYCEPCGTVFATSSDTLGVSTNIERRRTKLYFIE